jgi:hypothetical protein
LKRWSRPRARTWDLAPNFGVIGLFTFDINGVEVDYPVTVESERRRRVIEARLERR